MDWKRESEFRRLLSAQIKHLTKDGLETLAHIATTDMAESYKAVPALAMHKAKRSDKKGPERLHALRILDAIIAKSRQRHGSKDKFVPRIEASKAAQAIFAAISECAQEQKLKAAKVLHVWRKNNIFAPPTLAAAEDALGPQALLMEADSSAAAAPFGATSAAAAVSSGPAHDAPSAAPAAVQSNGAGHDAASTGPAEPVTAPRRAASLGASQLLPPPNGSAAAHPQPAADLPATLRPSAASDSSKLAFPPGISAAPLPGPPPREPLYAPTALASAPAKQPVAVPAAAPGAPPLPAEGVAPFQAGVDAVVLPSGATLCNPQGGRAKQRRSKFDQPAVPRPAAGSGLGSNGSVETHARIDSAPPISFGPREPSRPLLGGVRGTPDVPLPGPPARAGAAQQPYDRAPAHQPDDSRPHGSLSHPSHEAAAPAARTAAAAAPPPGADVSPSDPALVSRIRSSLATLRSDLDSKRSADPSNSPTPMLSTIPPIPGKSSTPPLQNPPLPPPMLDSTPSKSVLDALPARSAPIQPLPLPPVPTAASVPGIPGLLPKTQGPLLDAVAALPPPPTISVPPVFATAPQPQAGASAVDPAAAKPAAPPAWAPPPAPIEPAPPGLLEAMPPVPSLTGLPSMEVKPPRAFGEVWVPPAESASQSGPGPQPAAEPPPAPAPQHPPAATPPQGAAKAPAAWSQHAWGQSGPLPDDSAARAAQQGPSAHSALPSHPPAHQQYKQNPGPPPSQWDHAAQHMQTGHAQSQHTYHSGPPQLRPPSGPAMPRHRFSAPPLGLPFPQQGPDGPPHAPPHGPPPGLASARPYPSTHAPPSMPAPYNPFSASAPRAPPQHHHHSIPHPPSTGGRHPRPLPGGRAPPPLARPPPPADSNAHSWAPPGASTLLPPPRPPPLQPPMQPPANGASAAQRPYDPIAAAAEAAPAHPPLADAATGPPPSGDPDTAFRSDDSNAPLVPHAFGGMAANGGAAKLDGSRDDDAAGDVCEPDDGPLRKRRRSRWDANSDAQACAAAPAAN